MTFLQQTIRDVAIGGHTILIRADYNIPLGDDGQIRDDFRIQASLPTLRYAIDHGCKVVIMSHLGRPGGTPSKKYSLRPVADRLTKLLGQSVAFVDDCIGEKVQQAVAALTPGGVLLLENVRFYPGEEANDPDFARQIAEATGARYMVQDGFGVVHRAHATTSAITHFVPSVAGLLLEREVIMLRQAVDVPRRPFIAVLGGAKVSDKIPVITRFIECADKILIGGAMANTFLAYKGVAMGASRVEAGMTATLDAIYKAAARKVGADKVDDFLQLPCDVAIAHSTNAYRRRSVPIKSIHESDMALDIGDATAALFCHALEGAATIVWNGTLGLAEERAFRYGSEQVAKAIVARSRATSIVGGGDTADFVRSLHEDIKGCFSHVSTGGGASLEFISGEALPGIEALLTKQK